MRLQATQQREDYVQHWDRDPVLRGGHGGAGRADTDERAGVRCEETPQHPGAGDLPVISPFTG